MCVNRVKSVVFVSLIAVSVVSALAIHAPTMAQENAPPKGLRPDAPAYAVHGPYAVGTREFVIDPDTERPIPLFVWYPALNADGAEEAITYTIRVKWQPAPDIPTVVYGHALRDAVPDLSGGPYPVLVLSPGYGTNVASYTYLVEHVASYGFVVLGTEHLEGVYLAEENPMRDIPMSTVERPRDVRRALDFAEELTAVGGALEGLMDLDKVAVAGHSSGGYTALAAAGGRFDISAFNARCEAARAADDPNAWLCADLEPNEAAIAAMAGFDPMPEGLWPSLGDDRVDAIISMAGDSYLFDQAGLAEITVPVLAMGGTADTGTPFDWGVGPTFANVSSPQKVLVAFEGAEHAIFANGCEVMPWLVDIDFWWMCIDSIWDRDRTNDLTNHFATAFLLATLKGDTDAAAALAPEAASFPGITYETVGY